MEPTGRFLARGGVSYESGFDLAEETQSGAGLGARGLGSAARVGLWVALGAGAALRIWLAWHDDGIYWPDEIYQSLEPAHRLVFGYGIVAWEFVEGARNWALPG